LAELPIRGKARESAGLLRFFALLLPDAPFGFGLDGVMNWVDRPARSGQRSVLIGIRRIGFFAFVLCCSRQNSIVRAGGPAP